MTDKTKQADVAPAAAPVPPAPTPAPPAAPTFVLSPADAARQHELDAIRRQQAAEDTQRAASGTVGLVAVTAFTIVDGASVRVVEAGQVFTASGFDAPGFLLGRARLRDAVPAAGGGATITAG